MKKISLTDELAQKIVASIRSGGDPVVAAAAWGVPETLFLRWLARGKNRNSDQHYKVFTRQVEEAHAQARLKAEMAAFQDDPKHWLKRASDTSAPVAMNPFESEAYLMFLAKLREVLRNFPDALAAVSAHLTEQTPG